MLLVLINWLFIFFMLGMYGYASFFLLKKVKVFAVPIHEVSLDKAVLTGLVTLTTLCNFISLLSPINYKVNIAFAIVAIGIMIFLRRNITTLLQIWISDFSSWHWLTKTALGLVIIIALVKTVGPVLSDDEGGYHLPLIRWIENFQVTPGIANIEDRMGFNPGIYMTNAFFGMTWLFKGGLYDVNSFLFIIFGYSFLNEFDKFVKKDFSFLSTGILQTTALVFLFRAYLTTMDADFINIYGTIYILSLIVQKIEGHEWVHPDLNTFLAFYLFTFLITCKFSIGILAPVFLWLWITLLRNKHKVFTLSSFVICLIVAVSWIIRNYYISGYLIYPLYFLDVFHVDWKVPVELAKGQYYYVGEYAKIEFARNFNEYVIRDVPWQEWLPNWFGRIWAQLIGKVIIIGVPIGFSLFIYQLILSNSNTRQQNKKYLVLLLILSIATLIWFIKAPAIRFAWGWLLVFLVLSFGISFKLFLLRNVNLLRIGLTTLLLISLLRSSVASIIENADFVNHLLYPVEVASGNIYQTKTENGIKIDIAEDNFCRGISPPCFPLHYHPNIMPRGNKITDGFYIKK